MFSARDGRQDIDQYAGTYLVYSRLSSPGPHPSLLEAQPSPANTVTAPAIHANTGALVVPDIATDHVVQADE